MDNRESRQIIMTIITLAHGMGMKVVAEGIELREQMLELRRLDCGFGQGFLFSKPRPGPDIITMMGAASCPDRLPAEVGAQPVPSPARKASAPEPVSP